MHKLLVNAGIYYPVKHKLIRCDYKATDHSYSTLYDEKQNSPKPFKGNVWRYVMRINQHIRYLESEGLIVVASDFCLVELPLNTIMY